ncbi:MAG: DUF305 domain-containing protein [Candidatus Taylorbacteria bacterium]|nr:DUF305 domain-containing protein [Candidatus Taylorbacteria bacterium]
MENKNIGYLVVTAVVFLIIGMMVPGKDYKKDYRKNMQGMSGMHQMSNGQMMHNMGGGMEDMMKGMMAGLDGKTGTEFDQAFLKEMIVHHQGAVVMAEAVLKQSKQPELIQLAKDIISAQTKEIEMMKKWQGEWSK